MKRVLPFMLILATATVSRGEVSTRVCLADGNTPLEPINITPTLIEYPDIMVGTKLTIIVSSDSNGYWPCDLAIRGEYRNYGVLSARDFNESTGHYDGSIFLPAIGCEGYVCFWNDDLTETDGFSYTGDLCAVAGDWFIIDYAATSIGKCSVGFYQWYSTDPNYELSFSHVRTRDFNKDTKVDFSDFVVLASHWQETSCSEPDRCGETDLDTDGNVDFDDLMLFADYWLEKTE
jgi:hypothetical protein